MQRPARLRQLRYVVGASWILGGVCINHWSLASLLSADGSIQDLRFLISIWFFQAVVILWGVTVIAFWHQPIVMKLNLSFVVLACISPLVLEVGIRVCIGLGNPTLRQPRWYADYLDEDYWKLEYLWNRDPEVAFPKRRVHPVLGWSQTDVTDENPLGLEATSRKLLKDGKRPKILVYGDSFIKGSANPEFQIPRYLDDRIPEVDVIDLGVGGYGTDQIYLMFRESASQVENPVILFGVLVNDVDRAILSFRTWQKPFFTLGNDGNMQLSGIPIETDQDAFVRRNPPRIYSYFGRLLLGRFGSWSTYGQEDEKLIAEIKRVNSHIFSEFVSSIHDARRKPCIVLFYGSEDLQRVGWRERFLKETCDRHAVPYIDTKEFLLKNHDPAAASESFYVTGDGHHNNDGNQVIAEGVLTSLKRMGLIPLKSFGRVDQKRDSSR